ncbi:Ca2+/H+ antiporter [Sphingomonas melonis]|uniref:Ca2+/H+ antiporter n=2 Tax=Sphingomonas melonis TaxID=152682 RepID=A0A7Y9FQ18_9SPHN|nr:Ca2+/H+ antiporter [Sphingomonas melonis]
MTYLIIIPALIAVLLPVLSIAFPNALKSSATLNIALLVSMVIVAAYAVGVTLLALSDHRRVSAKLLPTRR